LLLKCPQCDREMAEVTARANPGSLIQLDQCRKCGGIWCDKWELFPVDGDEVERLDPVDEHLLRDRLKLTEKTLYCPHCADELHVFADPILPAEIQLRRCRHCDGIWLNRGQFRRYKNYQKGTRKQKLGREEIVAKLPEIYADTQSWVVTGTRGIFAYPRGREENHEVVQSSFANAAKLVLQSLARIILGI
jgi:Zn-finger nucleic acid-binding protein